jgi:hypothetical protein
MELARMSAVTVRLLQDLERLVPDLRDRVDLRRAEGWPELDAVHAELDELAAHYETGAGRRALELLGRLHEQACEVAGQVPAQMPRRTHLRALPGLKTTAITTDANGRAGVVATEVT